MNRPTRSPALDLPVDDVWMTTWNVFAGTDVDVLEPILQAELAAGVSFFFMQEAGGKDIDRMLRRNGLCTFVHDQFRLAWLPEVHEELHTRHRKTSNRTMDTAHGRKSNYVALGRFRHKPSGRKWKAGSYHTPAHVQRVEWNRGAPNRWEITKDAFRLFARIAANALVPHVVFAGDDNVDERNAGDGPISRFDFLLKGPLRQVQAPEPTHGGGRKIDDFRLKGMVPVGKGFVRRGGGDHKLFRLRLRFVGKRGKGFEARRG
jgi:hypothetical protein